MALAAGVSLQTVSNVINNPERVSAEKLATVRREIERLGYRPSTAARSLRKQRADAFGLQIPRATGRAFGTIHDLFLCALTAAAQEDGAHIVPFVADSGDELQHYDSLLAAHAVDGFILTDTRPDDPRPGWLREHGVAHQSFGRVWDDPACTNWVDVDGAHGTAQAVEHLVEVGYRHVAFLGWPEGSPVGDDRRRGWAQACVAHGRSPELTSTTPHEVLAAQRSAAGLLVALAPGDAIVCVSDTVALGAIMAITAAGLRVGQDIGVVGFDDCDFAAVFGLTTVRQPVGRIAAHMISRLRAEDPADIGTVITPNLVCRRSTHRD